MLAVAGSRDISIDAKSERCWRQCLPRGVEFKDVVGGLLLLSVPGRAVVGAGRGAIAALGSFCLAHVEGCVSDCAANKRREGAR